jgi:hypothetical protein
MINKGLPPPVTQLTLEQDLKLRVMEDRINENYEVAKKDIITLVMALQHQNFVLSNSITNLVKQWPTLHEDIIFIGPSERIQKEISTKE